MDVKDIFGLIGLAIIEKSGKGNLDPEKLAKHRHYNCRNSEEEIGKALHGNNRADFFRIKKNTKLTCSSKRKLMNVINRWKNLSMQNSKNAPLEEHLKPLKNHTKGSKKMSKN